MNKEERWIRAILRRGSRSAADKLIRSYYDEIYRYIYKQVKNREDAMDLTQEGFVAMLQSLSNYDSRKASFRTWLYHIISHKIIDSRRRYTPETIPVEEAELLEENDFTQQVSDSLYLEEIEAYICRFPPQTQEIFRMKVYGEHSFPEIASIIGEPEAKIKAQYYRLIQKIRKEFSYEGL